MVCPKCQQTIVQHPKGPDDDPRLLCPNCGAFLGFEEATHEPIRQPEAEAPRILKTLSPEEEKVIRKRFGIGCEQKLEEIGQEFGVTRERIRRIEAEALRRLRNPRGPR